MVGTSRQQAVTSSNFEAIMKHDSRISVTPMFVLLGIAGCYNVSPGRKFGKLIHSLIRTYQVIVVLAVTCSIARVVFIMTSDDTHTMMGYVTNLIYQFTCLTNCLISWKAFSDRFGHQRKMLKYINEIIIPTFENYGINLDYTGLRRKMIIVTIICTILMLIGPFTWIINFFVLLPPPEVIRETNMTMTITLPLPDSYIARTIILLPGIACDMSLVFISFYLVTISIVLKTIFRSYNTAFRQQLSENRIKCVQNLESWRGIHVKLCETVEGFDTDLGYFYANIHLWTLLLSIVVLYYLVRVPVHFLGIIIQLYYLILCLCLLFTVAIYAASIHEQAHKPLSFIYNMEIQHMDSTNLAQLTMFLSKLTGSQTGFTTCGLLLITKEFIVSIVGAFVTYFAVLYTL